MPPPPPMPPPGPDHPLTVEELEAAAVALPGKMDALREAFDRLAACSPALAPFTWVDLDAHVSSLQLSISLQVRQFRVLEAARAAAPAAAATGKTRGDRSGGKPEEEEEEVYEEEEEVLEVEEDQEVEEGEKEVFEVQEEVEEEVEEVVEVEEFVEQEDEEKGDEEMQERDDNEANNEIGNDGKDEEEVRDDRIDSDVKDGKDAKGEDRDADEEMQMANEEEQSSEDGNKASLDKEEDANMEEEHSTKDAKCGYQGAEEDTNMEVEHGTSMEEAVTRKASAMQGNKEEACGMNHEGEEQETHEGEEGAQNVMKEEMAVAKEVPRDQGNQSLPGGFSDRAAACATIDAQRLVKLLFTNTGLNLELQDALHGAPDAAALALHIVKLFLHDKMLKTTKAWVNCVGLIRMVPVLVTELSTDTIEQAKLVAKNWKEMIDNSECCTVLGSLSPWGFLYFLISYNIVSEFETKEIFRLFGTMPRKQQRMNYAMLFKGLRLTNRIPELMDYLIENGQQMDALYWARAFNLVDKYTPASLLKGYVEKAKQTAIEISQNNMTLQSRSVIIKELDNLRRAQDLEQQITDSSINTSIREEIKDLLGEFEKKKRSLTKSAKRKKQSLSKSASTSNSQQQHNKKHKKEHDHHEGQENQQQGQQNKLGEKLEEKLGKQEHHEGQESQKQGQQIKPGEKLEEKLDKQEHQEGQESQQQGQQSKLGEKLEEKLDKQELHKGQESQQQRLESKPGVRLEQKLDKPQQKQQQKDQDKQQQSKKQHVKWPRQFTPKLPAPAFHTVQNGPLRDHFGHPPFAAIHGVYHSYPAQAGWPGVPCVPPYAPQLGAPEYIIPFNALYPHPEFYPW